MSESGLTDAQMHEMAIFAQALLKMKGAADRSEAVTLTAEEAREHWSNALHFRM